MFQIKLLDKISPSGLNILKPDRYTYGTDISTPDGIIVRSTDMHALDFDDNLLAVARAGAGTNNIPIDQLSEQGVVVFNTPGANANAVKELVMAGMLMSTRKIFQSMEWVQTLKGKGDAVAGLAEKQKAQYVGPEVYQKNIGVIGLGAIGILVGNMARHFGMEVYGYDPFLSVDAAWRLSRATNHAETLDELYSSSDFITLHVPLNKETKEMINASSIAKMRDGVRILNFSRGELVNNADILAAVESGKVSCYVTDFAADELLGHPNVLVIPHLGASTPESEDNCAEMAALELREFLENGNIRNSVNLPNVSSPRTTPQRITVFHRNIPTMLTKISGTVGSNINNLTNNSKGDFAYTMIDIDQPVADEIIGQIKQIEGVIRVRVFS